MASLSRLLKQNAAANLRPARKWLSSAVTESDFKSPQSVEPNRVASRRDLDCRSVRWVFLGCPGAGKGSYASLLSRLLGVPHIATGDLVRQELASSGPLAKQKPEAEVS